MVAEKENEEPSVKLCNACAKDLPKEAFSKKQWLGSLKKQRRCKGCVESNREIPSAPSPVSETPFRASIVHNKSAKKARQKVAQAHPKKKHQLGRFGIDAPINPSQCMDVQLKLSSNVCAWCGKTEEIQPFLHCMGCKNILYCSRTCQKASWPDHKMTCDKMKEDRINTKAQRKAEKKSGSFASTENSGTGHVAIVFNPAVICHTLHYGGDLRCNREEEHGAYCVSEATKHAMNKKVGHRKFQEIMRGLFNQTMECHEAGKYKCILLFMDVEELPDIDLFLLSCGPLKEIDRAKALLPSVLNQVRTKGSKTDGTMFDIGDVTARGYKLNALEWASRRGNYEIAEWLATDPRTKIMVTRADSAPVAWACYTNRVELARMLIQNGADSGATTSIVWNWKPPLHLAGEKGNLQAVRFLVEECGHDIVGTRDIEGLDLRASIRKYNPYWEQRPGCVAVDDYAKSKMGVDGNVARMSKKRMHEIVSTSKKKIAQQQKQKQNQNQNQGESVRARIIAGSLNQKEEEGEPMPIHDCAKSTMGVDDNIVQKNEIESTSETKIAQQKQNRDESIGAETFSGGLKQSGIVGGKEEEGEPTEGSKLRPQERVAEASGTVLLNVFWVILFASIILKVETEEIIFNFISKVNEAAGTALFKVFGVILTVLVLSLSGLGEQIKL